MKGDTSYTVKNEIYNGLEVEDMLGRVCECGHTFGQHAHTWLPVSGPMVFVSSQCLYCGSIEKDMHPTDCSQFREA